MYFKIVEINNTTVFEKKDFCISSKPNEIEKTNLAFFLKLKKGQNRMRGIKKVVVQRQ